MADLETERTLRRLNSKLKFPESNELMKSSFIQKISEVPLLVPGIVLEVDSTDPISLQAFPWGLGLT